MFSFFQFLFLAFQVGHPFGERLVAGYFVLAAECVDFVAGKFFLLTRHDAILHPSVFGCQRNLVV